MATTITLKNIPDHVYERLKDAAQRNRRSLNQEVIVRLEDTLAVRFRPTEAVLTDIRAFRDRLDPAKFRDEDIDAFKREGRP